MSFDWGGFTGSIIGALSAYGAAVYSFKKQLKKEEPTRKRETYELSLKINQTLSLAWSELFTCTASMRHIFEKVIEYQTLLKYHLPEAIETSPELVRILHESIERVDDICQKYSREERSDENIVKCKNEILNTWGLNKKDCDDISKKILDEIYESTRADKIDSKSEKMSLIGRKGTYINDFGMKKITVIDHKETVSGMMIRVSDGNGNEYWTEMDENIVLD